MRSKRKLLITALPSERTFYIQWYQHVDERGRIVGIGYFRLINKKEANIIEKRNYQKKK